MLRSPDTQGVCRERESLTRIFELVSQGVLRPIYPLNCVDVADELSRAMRQLMSGKAMGKIVLRVQPDRLVPVIHTRSILASSTQASPYLLVGGLGGIGRSLAVLFSAHGARDLAIHSPKSGDSREESRDYLGEAEGDGLAEPNAAASDISDGREESSLPPRWERCSGGMPPIRECWFKCSMKPEGG